MLKLKKKAFRKLKLRIRRGIFRFLKVSKKNDWICRFFFRKNFWNFRKKFNFRNSYFYRLDKIEPQVFLRKNFVKSSIGFRLMRMFYLTLSYRKIRKIFRLAKSKTGMFASNYLLFLESRILSLIYRCSLLKNIFEAIRFIRKGNVIINREYIFLPNKKAGFFSLINFKGIFKGYIYWALYRRLVRRAILSSIPRYVFFSYQFIFFFLIKTPKGKDIINPFPMDAFKISTFALKKY